MSQKLKISKWVLTPHAAERLAERKISIDELQRLLSSPDEVSPQGPKYLLIGHFPKRSDNKLAAVVLEKKGDLWLVITVLTNFVTKK
ncbi:MAG: DUF4258 domain-containing protein [Pseudobdellovibrionaceae bacterium]